jgi:GNAT superfamily N-acetyltransferase
MTILAPLRIADAPHVQRLFERCADFFVLTEGQPPAPDLAEKELTFTIPGGSPDDIACFGVFDGDRLVAFAGLARDFPKPSEWWLGLLVIDPAERGRGLGARIHQELVDWIAAQSGTTLWLAVQTNNEAAERFWRRMGFEERERQPYVSPRTGFQSAVILMSLSIAAAIRTTPSSPSG